MKTLSRNFFLLLLCLFLLQGKHRLHKNRALQTLLLNRTANLVRLPNVPMKEIGVGMSAAAAVEPCPAVAAERLVQHM